MNLGLVPKKDVDKHKEEIRSLKTKIDEEKERLRFMKESGELEEYVTPKRSPARQAYAEPHTLPDMEMGDNMTDAGLDMETEASTWRRSPKKKLKAARSSTKKANQRLPKRKTMKIPSPTETAGNEAFSKTPTPTIGSLSLFPHPVLHEKVSLLPFLRDPRPSSHHQLLHESLAIEWERQKPLLEGKEITSIYFGGGTPTLFPHIGSLLERIPRSADCEITIEANPEESTPALFTHLRSLGINRLSLGVQSLDDRSLLTLERIHSAEKARQAIFNAHQAGFRNISIDLMYDLPDQTEESWRYTLDQLPDLPIQHLSLYNLTIEPHTPFFKRKVQTPPQDLSLRFLQTALEKLESIGLHRYEISAFAKPNHASRHNLGYWTGRPFLGFGPSAFSYWDQERFRNIANLNRYANLLRNNSSPVDFREKLPYPASVKELLAIHIRLKEGADLARFDLPPETTAAIEKLKSLQLLSQQGSQIRLTDRGMLFYDTVATELI